MKNKQDERYLDYNCYYSSTNEGMQAREKHVFGPLYKWQTIASNPGFFKIILSYFWNLMFHIIIYFGTVYNWHIVMNTGLNVTMQVHRASVHTQTGWLLCGSLDGISAVLCKVWYLCPFVCTPLKHSVLIAHTLPCQTNACTLHTGYDMVSMLVRPTFKAKI